MFKLVGGLDGWGSGKNEGGSTSIPAQGVGVLVLPFMQLINGGCHDTDFLASNYFKILIMRLKVNLEQSSIGEGVLTHNQVNLEMQMAFYHATDHKTDTS